MGKLKRIVRERRLTTAEAAKYNAVIAAVDAEVPKLIARHLRRQSIVEAGQKVLPRAGSKLRKKDVVGTTTGSTRYCTLEGCSGTRIGVRWPDKKITWPCSKGMSYDEKTKTWEIL